MLSSHDREYKLELYGLPTKALKVYMNVFLPIIMLRWTWLFVDKVFISGIANPVIFVKDTIFLILAIISFITVRGLGNAGQAMNLAFLVYWILSSLVEFALSIVAMQNTPKVTGGNTDATVNAIAGYTQSFLNLGMGILLLVEILGLIISIVFCVFYIGWFIKHTKLFCKSIERLQKENG